MTKTHTVIKTTRQATGGDKDDVLSARAARFNLTTTTGVAGSSTAGASAAALVDPAEAERRAARAARFADVKSAPPISTTGKVSIGGTQTNITSTSVVDAEKLAKRAARFADIPKESK